MAEKGGQSYSLIAGDCMQGLKIAIEYEMPANIKEKKSKLKQFMHAKDNAVSALGKIIRYQTASIDPNVLVPYWLNQLPIKHDVEEAKIQNDILATIIQDSPTIAFGAQYERFE